MITPHYKRNSRFLHLTGALAAVTTAWSMSENSSRPYILMRHFRKEIWMNIPKRLAFINITGQVREALRESGIQNGLCLVNSMHISSSVFINDDESGLHHDFEVWLEKYIPHEPIRQYRHNDTGEDNADAHLKRQVFGREVVVAITDGDFDFGPWEQIFYGEFDGRRKKRILVKIIGE